MARATYQQINGQFVLKPKAPTVTARKALPVNSRPRVTKVLPEAKANKALQEWKPFLYACAIGSVLCLVFAYLLTPEQRTEVIMTVVILFWMAFYVLCPTKTEARNIARRALIGRARYY